MRFTIGTVNPSKVNALLSVLEEYEEFRGASVHAMKAASRVAEQPKSLEEICLGARNRAHEAFHSAVVTPDLSVGLESGLIVVPGTKTGMMVTTACMIYDGNTFSPGLSSAFECPESVIALVRERTLDLNAAFRLAGLTEDPRLGVHIGAIGVLTKGHVTRSQYMMQAIRAALIPHQNPGLY